MKRNLLFLVLAIMGFLYGMTSCQKAPELTLTSSSNIEFSADGSSGSITFTANRDWRVSSSDSWVTVSPSSGAASDGPVTVNVRCNANTTYEDRTATVTVTMEGLTQTVTVRQPANLGIVLPTQAFDLHSGAKNIDVTVQANVDYSVDISANWIKQTGTKALTSKTLSFSIEENKTYDAREGIITIKPKQAGVVEQVISVKQAQKEALNVEKTSYEMPYGGGEVEIKVEASVGFDVTPNVDWLHYVSTKALTNSTVLIKVDENETYSSREGKIEIAQQNGSLKHTITVQQAGRIAVTSVELDQTSLTLKPEGTSTLVATVKPDNATDKTVTWTSSDSEVATVDETGKVTALKVGNATITASAGFKSAECKVTVYIPVSSIELSKTKLYLNIGESETLVATIKPDDATDKSIVWTSSDDTIATVDDNGKVTAIKEGKATIKAKAGEKEAECSVSVGIAVTGIKLDNTSLEIRVDDTATLTATVSPDNATDKTVTWTSSDATVASVDESGTVKAIKVGTATITATAGEKSATCAVTVKKKVPAGAVDLGITIYPEEGDSYELFWAECNLDASKPEEYGGYYAWGEIETKNEYTWYTYKWCTGGYLNLDGGKLTKYNNREFLGVIDEKQQLDPEDDAAHVKLGGKWRIPTKDEFQALQNGCTNVEETLNGVKGRRFTSRVNGNSIFLPYAGRAADTSIADAGKQGDYSTSSLRVMNGEYGDHASYLYMSMDYVYVASLTREIGFSIRPVTE